METRKTIPNPQHVKNPLPTRMSNAQLAWYAQKRRKQRLVEDYQEIDDSLHNNVDEGGPI